VVHSHLECQRRPQRDADNDGVSVHSHQPHRPTPQFKESPQQDQIVEVPESDDNDVVSMTSLTLASPNGYSSQTRLHKPESVKR
jgi:hypothetical protein